MFNLFSNYLINKRLTSFVFPEDTHDRQLVIDKWYTQLKHSQQIINIHEFLHDLFVEVLGYKSPFNDQQWELELEPIVGLGFFTTQDLVPVVSIDYSAISEQSEQVKNSPTLVWQIVIDRQQISLYRHQDSLFRERFKWQDLVSTAIWQRFYLLFCRRTLLPRFIDTKSHAQILWEESHEQEIVTLKHLYQHITSVREYLTKDFKHRLGHLPNHQELAHRLAMTLIKRLIFIAYAEDHQLLPKDIISSAYEFFNPYQNQSAWDNYKVIFGWLQQGNSRLKEPLPIYSCSLFAHDPILDETLYVGDEICRQLKEITKFNWGEEVSRLTLNGLLDLLLHSAKKRLTKHPSKYLLSADQVITKINAIPSINYDQIAIVDRQCRSGTLLATAFYHLIDKADEPDTVAPVILSKCLFGSDPDPEAIALTRLNLWLVGLPYTAPLPALEQHICIRLEQEIFQQKTVVEL